MDNSNVQKKERRVGPPLSTHVWAFTSVYYISHGVLSGFSASPLMFMKIGQVERENLNATKLGQCKAGNLANKKQSFKNNCALCELLCYVQICNSLCSYNFQHRLEGVSYLLFHAIFIILHSFFLWLYCNFLHCCLA